MLWASHVSVRASTGLGGDRRRRARVDGCGGRCRPAAATAQAAVAVVRASTAQAVVAIVRATGGTYRLAAVAVAQPARLVLRVAGCSATP